MAEHDTKVVSFYCNFLLLFGDHVIFLQLGLPAVLIPWKGEGDAYCICQNPFAPCAVARSERVHVRQVERREASGEDGSCDSNLRLLPVNKAAGSSGGQHILY